MSLQTSCPSCNKVFTLPDALFGKRIKCKNCGGVFRVGGGEVAPTDEAFDELAASAATQPDLSAQPDTGGGRKMPGIKHVEGMFPTQIEGMTNVPPAPNAYFGEQTDEGLTSDDTHTDAVSSGDTVSDAIPGAMALDQTSSGMDETTTLPDDTVSDAVPGEGALSSGDTVSDAVPPAGAELPPTQMDMSVGEAAPEAEAQDFSADIPSEEPAAEVPEGEPEEEAGTAGKKKLKLPGKGKLPGKAGKKETKSLDKKAPLPGKGKLPAGRKADTKTTAKKSGSKLPILLFIPLLLVVAAAALIIYVPQVREMAKLSDDAMVNDLAAKVGGPVTNKKDEVAKTPEQPKDEPKEQPKEEPKPDQPKPDEPKPDQPKPDEPKPDQPKPDRPKEEYAETGFEHLLGGKKGYWAVMETKSHMGGTDSRMVQQFIFDRIEGKKAFLQVVSWMFINGEPSRSESELGPLALKVSNDAKPEEPDPDTKFEKGDETLTLAGKEWRCKWLQTTTTKDGKTTVIKVWKAIDRSINASIAVAGGGTGMVKMEWKSGEDTMTQELIALGTDTEEYKLPGASVDQPKPDEPKPDDGMVEVTIPGAKWLRDLAQGDWVLMKTYMKGTGFEMTTFARYVFDRLDGDDAVLKMDSLSDKGEAQSSTEMRVSTVDKVERVKKAEGEPVQPVTGEETISAGGRDFLCVWTETETSDTKSRRWQVKDKSDPKMIGLANGGWGYVKMTSSGNGTDMLTETLAWGASADDYKAKLPGASVEQPKPDEPKPDQPKPEDDMVEVRTPSPYKHLANLDPGMWVIMEEHAKGHLLDDTFFHLIKFRTLDGDFAVLSVETTIYATGKGKQTKYEELRLNTADDVKKYKKGEEPPVPEKPAQTEETINIAGRDILCFLTEFTEGEEKWKAWSAKDSASALGLAGRGKLLGTGAVKVVVNAGEVQFSAQMHSSGTSMETPVVPEPAVEQPKPDEPKPDQPKPDEPKPEDEYIEVTIPGAKWLTQCEQGDWVIMENLNKNLGSENVSWMRYVFVKIDGDDAVLNIEMHMKDGAAIPGTEARVRVTDKVERIKKADVKEPPKSTTGEETLSLGGRDFVCVWTEFTTEGGYLMKTWLVKDKNDPRMIGLASGGSGTIQSTMHGESSGTDFNAKLVAFGTSADDYKGHLPKPVVEQPKPDEPKPDQPKPDQPKPDEPKVENPKPDEPKPDQPKPDQPKLPDPKVEKPEQPSKMPESKWPAYKRKQPAEAKFGKPTDYFNEDFNNPKYDWGWLPAGVRLVKGTPDQNGALEMDANSTLRFSGNISECEVRMTIWRDLNEVDREKTGSDSKGYEIVFRWTDAQNYCSLQIRCDGYYRILKVSGGKASVLVGDSKGGYLAIPRWNKDLDYDNVVLTVRKDGVGASFNGYRLVSSNDASSASGNVGVRTFNGLKAAIEKLDVNE